MTDHEFFFSIELTGSPVSLDMLRELVSHALAQVGRGDQIVPAVVDAVQTAVTRASASNVPCRVKFVAQGGRLDIAVSAGDGPAWRTSHDIA